MFVESFEGKSAEPMLLDGVTHHWETLARTAAVPNAFYEHWALLPALRELARADAVRLLLVWDDESRSTLLALLPLCVARGLRGVPVGRTALWRHPYSFLCTLLLAEGQRGGALAGDLPVGP